MTWIEIISAVWMILMGLSTSYFLHDSLHKQDKYMAFAIFFVTNILAVLLLSY